MNSVDGGLSVAARDMVLNAVGFPQPSLAVRVLSGTEKQELIPAEHLALLDGKDIVMSLLDDAIYILLKPIEEVGAPLFESGFYAIEFGSAVCRYIGYKRDRQKYIREHEYKLVGLNS